MEVTAFRSVNQVHIRFCLFNLVTRVAPKLVCVYSFASSFLTCSCILCGRAELAQLTGIAAILRFPLPDLDDIEM